MTIPRIQNGSRRIQGFTLIELLVVITIMALMAALTMGAFTFAQKSAARGRTTATQAAIIVGLERYRADFGEFPQPENPGTTMEVNTRDYDISGAAMLYQALSGDGYDQILFASGTEPIGDINPISDGSISEDEAVNIKMTEMPDTVRRQLNGLYFMTDGFNNPFQYTHGSDDNAVNRNSFDLWSYGEDETNTLDTSRETKLNSPEITEIWIKNW